MLVSGVCLQPAICTPCMVATPSLPMRNRALSLTIQNGEFANHYVSLSKFCYGVYNQCESFIYLNLIVKNREVSIERYFKWLTSTKLV
jgi:hypothetical protein